MEYNPEMVDNARFIYSRYLAIKRHFENDYDYWKYNGKVSNNFTKDLERKKEFYTCVTLYNKYKSIDEIEKILVLNSVNNLKFWLGSINYKYYEEFKKYKEGSEYFFKQEIKFLFKDGEYNSKFNVSDDYPHSYLYESYQNGLIKLETLIILNMITGFLDLAHSKYSDFVFEDEFKKIKKYQNFLEKWNVFDILRYKKIIKNLISENKTN